MEGMPGGKEEGRDGKEKDRWWEGGGGRDGEVKQEYKENKEEKKQSEEENWIRKWEEGKLGRKG